MAIIETKADELMALIDEKKNISTKDAANELGVDEKYVRKLAYILQKNKLIDLKASSFAVNMIDRRQS